jgi:hypothetical protein
MIISFSEFKNDSMTSTSSNPNNDSGMDSVFDSSLFKVFPFFSDSVKLWDYITLFILKTILLIGDPKTIAGYETMHMIRKGQVINIAANDMQAQVTFINKLSLIRSCTRTENFENQFRLVA